MKRSVILLASFSYCLASYAAGSKELAAAGPRNNPIVFQSNHSPGFCMGIAGGSTQPRALVKQGSCDLGDKWRVPKDQVWLLEKIGNKTGNAIYYRIRNAKNQRMCLGVERGSRAPRANIRQGFCNDNPDQRWSLPNIPGNDDPAVVNIKNAYGLCIGAERGSTKRAQLKQNRCSGAKDQKWVKFGVSFPG